MTKIIIAGDIFPVPTNFEQFAQGDIETLFGKEIIELFSSSDYRICNLEGALTDYPGFCEKTGPTIYAPTKTIRAYKVLGIDCCALANNHITDAGDVGVIDTIKTLDKAEINYLGAGVNKDNIKKCCFIQVGEHNICLYNVAETMYNAPTSEKPGANLYDEYLVCREIESLKKECDYVIVIYHGGAEKFRYPSPQTKQRFHRMVDSGADMILSQHTHCVGTEEFYKGAYLLYGQGNFLFRSFNNEFTDTGLLLELSIEKNKVDIKKHLVRAVGDKVRYDEKQDFTDFYARSAFVSDDAKTKELFGEYSLKELPIYLSVFRKQNVLYRKLRKYCPKIYKRMLFQGFERRQLLRFLHTLRSEQNREIAIRGIELYLNNMNKNSERP